MKIKFDKYEFGMGQKFYAEADPGTITLLHCQIDHSVQYVLLGYDFQEPTVMLANEFANYVVNKVYIPFTAIEPAYKVGNRFIQQGNDDTIHILGISERKSHDYDDVKYFVAIVSKLTKTLTYTTVNEEFLKVSCLPWEEVYDTEPIVPIPEPEPTWPPVEYPIEFI